MQGWPVTSDGKHTHKAIEKRQRAERGNDKRFRAQQITDRRHGEEGGSEKRSRVQWATYTGHGAVTGDAGTRSAIYWYCYLRVKNIGYRLKCGVMLLGIEGLYEGMQRSSAIGNEGMHEEEQC